MKKCDKCGKRFYSDNQLRCTFCGSSSEVICDRCGKTICSDRPLKCPFCGQNFREREEIELCPICCVPIPNNTKKCLFCD